jgi:hypothetical protein
MRKNKLLVGTAKGLVLFERKQEDWKPTQVSFKGMTISAFHFDALKNIWWVGIFHKHWGQKIYISKNGGKDWEMVSTPLYPEGAKLSDGKPASLRKVWTIGQSNPENGERIWLGTQPGALFYSDDYGKSFNLSEGLWNLPSRSQSDQWFGAGGNQPFIHTVAVDPRDQNHLYIAVSSAGVFETWDNGSSWKPCNNGLVAAFLPNPNVEIGHDPHRLIICKADPNVIWQQNHCGIFRSTNGGKDWDNVTDKNGLADYGFALAIDHENPERAWVIPLRSDVERIPIDLALCVCRTENGGKDWVALRTGLPQAYCFDIVFRHSFDINKNELVFGTTTGNVYLSNNFGDSWTMLSFNLQRIENITFV